MKSHVHKADLGKGRKWGGEEVTGSKRGKAEEDKRRVTGLREEGREVVVV